jgi:tetratricopeptide (TPR) repeat protein
MYLNAGDSTTADSLDQVVNQEFPSMHLYPEAKKLVQQGRFDKAKILIDSLETLDPTMVEFLTIRGYWNLERRKYYAALEDLKQAAILGKYDPQILANLAGVYFALHRYEAMMKVLRRGQRRNPNSKDVLLGFAVGFYTMNNYDSAAVYANRLMEEHPDESDAYFILGMTAYKTGQADRAQAILRRYLEMAPHGTYAKRVENVLQKLK